VAGGELIPVYSLSQRRPATRFIYALPLIVDSKAREEYQRVFMREVNRQPPSYILLDENYANWIYDSFPEFKDFLKSNYTVVTRLGTNELWRQMSTCCKDLPLQEIKQPDFEWGPWAR
jgi:hypothetical protein